MNKKEIILSRIDITGELDLKTPKIVLEEIANSISVKFDSKNNSNIYLTKIITKLSQPSKKNIIIYNFENDINSLRIIAKYVNVNCKNWRKKELLKAFIFLENFRNEKYIEDFLKSSEKYLYNFGLQTYENPTNLNACVLYRLCKYFSINTDFNSTYEEMGNKLRLYYYITENSKIKNNVKMAIFDSLKFQYSDSDLINVLSMTSESSNQFIPEEIEINKIEDVKNITYEDISKCADEIDLMEEDEKKDKPNNACEAIVMAGIYYKIDLTKCKDPFSEYQLLKKEIYFPHDSDLKEKIKFSNIYPESLDNPWINKNFNPNLPESMYSERDLITLCSEEGIYSFDESYYSSLQVAYLTETFIHGKQGNITNKETSFFEKIENLEYDEVIVYGIRGNQNEKNYFRAYTYGELLDNFANYKRFSDPITSEIFSDEVINKLYLLTQKEKRTTESEEKYKERSELGEEIERVKIYFSINNEYIEKFLEKYEKLNDDDKERVEKVLMNILHLGMYMRGWNGIGNYPLTSQETNYESDKQIVIDDRVTQCLIDLENKIKNLNDLNKLGNFILNLPLMQHNNESNTFVTSNDENEGLTINDRIYIVRKGEDENGMSSCIRLSSNKFCATAYFYMVLIGFRLPFNMNEVSHIY